MYFKQSILITTILLLTVSCKNNNQTLLGNYKRDVLNLPATPPDSSMAIFDTCDYDITQVIPLSLPNDIIDINAKTLSFCNNRIYACDIKSESVLAFDDKGHFLYKVCRLGHAKNEIISRIECFDIDRKTNYLHVYNREGCKILIFDDKGKYVRSIMLKDCIPTSIAMMTGGNYLASCDYASTRDRATELLLLDENGAIVKTYLKSNDGNIITCEGTNTRPLFSDHKGNITYLSVLADSLIVFSEHKGTDVIKLNFEDGFLSEDEIEQAKHKGDIYVENRKVQFISKALNNDFFVLIRYFSEGVECNYLYDKCTKKYYIKIGSLAFSRMFCSVLTICDDNLVAFISKEDAIGYINLMSSYKPNSIGRRSLQRSFEPISLDIMTGKIKSPVIIKFKLR